MIVTPRDEQVREEWRPGVLTYLCAAASTGAESLCVIEQQHQPGAGAPPHRHDVEEVVVVLEGSAEFEVARERAVLGPGDAVVVPAEVVHAFRNTGADLLRVCAVLCSASPSVAYEDDPGRVLRIGVDPATHRVPAS